MVRVRTSSVAARHFLSLLNRNDAEQNLYLFPDPRLVSVVSVLSSSSCCCSCCFGFMHTVLWGPLYALLPLAFWNRLIASVVGRGTHFPRRSSKSPGGDLRSLWLPRLKYADCLAWVMCPGTGQRVGPILTQLQGLRVGSGWYPQAKARCWYWKE